MFYRPPTKISVRLGKSFFIHAYTNTHVPLAIIGISNQAINDVIPLSGCKHNIQHLFNIGVKKKWNANIKNEHPAKYFRVLLAIKCFDMRMEIIANEATPKVINNLCKYKLVLTFIQNKTSTKRSTNETIKMYIHILP